MRFGKQLVLSLVLLAAGLCLWFFLAPGAAETLSRFGLSNEVVAAIAPQNSSGGAQGEGRRSGGQAAAPLVVAEPVRIGRVNDRLNAIGSGEAIHSVVVMPQVSGTITEILVSSGDRVTRGQILARLDNDEEIIARNQAAVSLRSAREKSQLYRGLQSSVSRLDVFNAEIAEEAAKLALDNAELNLRRRDIVAPIDGIAGIVAVNTGDNVTSQTSVVTLDDRSELLVDFWVPERLATALKVGHPVQATSVARPGDVYDGVIDAIDNRIDPASRTLRVRARLANDEDELRAGMSFAVTMRFAGEDYPAVSPLAIQWDAEGSFVWRISDNKAEKVPVRIIQRNPDAVLVRAELLENDPVVTEGLQRVRAGGLVRLANGEVRQTAAVTE